MSKGKPSKAAVRGAESVRWCFDHIPFCHLWVQPQLRRFVDKYMALEHLVVYLWSKSHAVAVKNMSRREPITISFPA